MLNVRTALILAPHADDAEFGCGGTIAKLVDKGVRVYSLILHGGSNPESLRASEGLQVERILYDLQPRIFFNYRQDILEKLLELKKSINPDLVIQPSLSDIHQDHQVVAQEGLRAFKDTNLWGYEVPWNNLKFDAQLFVSLDDRHVEMKVAAIQCFKSQIHKSYANEACIRSLMITRGVQVGVKNAEAFNVIRQIL